MALTRRRGDGYTRHHDRHRGARAGRLARGGAAEAVARAVIAADPYLESGKFARFGVERTDLDTLLRESDVVTLHCNLTARDPQSARSPPARAHEADGRARETPPRGLVVDVEALCDAPRRAGARGRGIDVLPEEPPPRGARILRLGERVLLAPHMIAGNQGGTLGAAIPWAADAALAALRGQLPDCVLQHGGRCQVAGSFRGHVAACGGTEPMNSVQNSLALRWSRRCSPQARPRASLVRRAFRGRQAHQGLRYRRRVLVPQSPRPGRAEGQEGRCGAGMAHRDQLAEHPAPPWLGRKLRSSAVTRSRSKDIRRATARTRCACTASSIRTATSSWANARSGVVSSED